jgi:hypothetical protein
VAAAAAAAATAPRVVGFTDYSRMDRTVLMVKLMPDTPYVLVPSTAEPGEELRACCWQHWSDPLRALPEKMGVYTPIFIQAHVLVELKSNPEPKWHMSHIDLQSIILL